VGRIASAASTRSKASRTGSAGIITEIRPPACSSSWRTKQGKSPAEHGLARFLGARHTFASFSS
jgi:hypothetical protein